jgi:hypothetical protein
MPQRLKSLIQLHERTASQPVAFCYRGPFHDQFTHTILEIYDGTHPARQSQPMVNRKVSFLLVECFQNILRHGESVAGSEPDFRDDGLFSFRSIGDEFIINSINIVAGEEVADLERLMINVNSLDPNQLKELYLDQLNKARLSEKGGAGLGLIELARKSGRKVLYQFEEAPGGRKFFHQQVTFCSGEQKKEVTNYIAETRRVYEEMASENSLLCYKGHFSQKSILPMLEIVEHNMAEGIQLSHIGRKTGHILVEILQNIARHGSGEASPAEGIFTLGWRDGHIVLQAGNVVDDEEKDFLTEKLTYLRGLSREELLELHKAALKASLKFENKTKSGLGLIEIARASSSPIIFDFHPFDRGHHLFVLHVSI